MPPRMTEAAPFDTARYTETVSRLSSLKSRLPADAVATLAGEVLSRVTRHAGTNALPIGRINALALALIDEDPDLCLQMVLDLQAEGKSVETLYLDYLAVAARRLGELWEDDRVSFSQVSVGTARIYGLLRAIDAPYDHPGPSECPAAFFAAVPGEEHTLGIRMAADLFRRRGWEVDLAIGLGHEEVLERLDTSGHRLVGLSASNMKGLAPLARLLLAIRSHRPGTRVMVAGNLVADEAELVAELCPDREAADFEAAFEGMTALWNAAGRPRG